MSANIGFAGIQYRWFIGQVPPDQSERSKDAERPEVWGSRVKIRIPGIHERCDVTDDDLPWAIVAKPTNQGNYAAGSTGIYGGEWVIGFFLDESNQVPVITHVLGRNSNKFDLIKSENGCTNFKNVSRYNSGVEAGSHQTKAGEKPNSSVATDIPIGDWNASKDVTLNINNS
jgi:hypothetical protein